jgi:phosphoglycerate dehydrogenase-like enzyme
MCDVITVHVPLNKSTENLITKSAFEQMKPSAYFINTSRSNVVNGQDLYEALCYGKIKGAGIDVIEGYTEELKNVLYAIRDSSFITTPHIAGFTEESREKTDIWLAKQVLYYWENKRG